MIVALVVLVLSWLWIFIFMNNLSDYMTAAITCEDYYKAKLEFELEKDQIYQAEWIAK